MKSCHLAALCLLLAALVPAGEAFAHGVQAKDAEFIAVNQGVQIVPFLYLGAKHMVTGYDHLLFILGVIFFLYRLAHVAIYVTLFSLGHSITLLTGVLNNIDVDPYIVDAVIGVSVAYKAFDNLGGFQTVFGWQPDNRVAVFGFGLFHGLGLATKLQVLALSSEGLFTNMIAFNIGVEIGQLIALSAMLLVIVWWRTRGGFERHALVANVGLMIAGVVLTQYQLLGYALQTVE